MTVERPDPHAGATGDFAKGCLGPVLAEHGARDGHQARAVQGIGAALAAPSSLALIATNFAEGPARNQAFGVYAGAASAGGSIGLILGGMLTAWASWRWVMFTNVPIGLALAALAPIYIQESTPHPGRFDLAGALASTAGIAALVYGFVRAGAAGWSDAVTLGAFLIAAGLLGLFLAVEARAEQPITPLRLFRSPARSGAFFNSLLVRAAMFGMFFFLTQVFQEAQGLGPLQAGLAFLPTPLVILACSRLLPGMLPRIGERRLLIGGFVLLAAATMWLTGAGHGEGYVAGTLGPLVLLGAGAAAAFLSLNLAALSGVEPAEAGAASGMLQAMQQVGGSLGLGVLVTVFGTAMRHATAAAGAGPRAALLLGAGAALRVAALFAIAGLTVALLTGRAETIAADPAQDRPTVAAVDE